MNAEQAAQRIHPSTYATTGDGFDEASYAIWEESRRNRVVLTAAIIRAAIDDATADLRRELLEYRTTIGTLQGMLRGLLATCEIDPGVRERIEAELAKRA